MISFVKGTLSHKDVEHAVIDVGGVGYQVFLSLTGIGRLPDAGAEVMVHTHMHVREDAMVLFGFLDTFEREVFRLLIGVNGIGPKLAINILSGIGADELVASIGGEDLRRLNAIPGVGKKLAERIVLELRGKVPARGHAAPPTPALAAKGGVWADLQSALVNLGYKPARVDKALDELREGGAAGDLQTLLREALRLVT